MFLIFKSTGCISLFGFCYCCMLCSGGLRLKRDITEYGDFLRNFNAPTVDEKFEQLGM